MINHKLYLYKVGDDQIVAAAYPDGVKIKGVDGYNDVSGVFIKTNSLIYHITTCNGFTLKCSANHLLFTQHGLVKAKDITKSHILQTIHGESFVKKIKKQKYREFVYDLSMGIQDMSYYSDGILSHNSIITGIYLTHYLLTHFDKNCVCTSATDDKVKDLMKKIEVIMMELPFWLKLGLITDNVKTKVFDNGCSIKGETATVKSGASITCNGVLYCDEFALIDPSIMDIFYYTVLPTVSSSKEAQVILTSTARGRNLFWQIYDSAMKKLNDYIPLITYWYEVEGRDDQWKRKEIANLGGSEQAFEQEYGCNFDVNTVSLLQPKVVKYINDNLMTFNNLIFSKSGEF